MTLYTIGFTKKNAETFFNLLRKAGVKRVLDVRLNNTSQLAGFAKRDDLAFFLREICQADYVHLPQFAPTQEILDAFKKQKSDWASYAEAYGKLLEARQAEKTVDAALLDGGCLLCSEAEAEQCHRRLAAEHLRRHFAGVGVVHL